MFLGQKIVIKQFYWNWSYLLFKFRVFCYSFVWKCVLMGIGLRKDGLSRDVFFGYFYIINFDFYINKEVGIVEMVMLISR